MKITDIPFNMNFFFDDSLRDRPESVDEMRQGVLFLKEKRNGKNLSPQEYASISSFLGVYLRMLNELEESQHCLQQAENIYATLQERANLLGVQLRLATTLHWQKNYQEAEEIYLNALQQVSQNPELNHYQDFIIQHLGKSKFAQRQFPEALQLFQEALIIRQEKGDSSLLASTQKAIEITIKQLTT